MHFHVCKLDSVTFSDTLKSRIQAQQMADVICECKLDAKKITYNDYRWSVATRMCGPAMKL